MGSETTSDVPARVALAEVLIHQVSSNDEVERRGVALPINEADLSQSSIPSLAHRRRAPRSLEPIVRRPHTLTLVRAITLAHLPAYTADWLLRNLRFEQPGVSKCGLSGGAFALTSTLESTPTRTLEAHWRCPFNLCHPLRCRRGFPHTSRYRSAGVPVSARCRANAAAQETPP